MGLVAKPQSRRNRRGSERVMKPATGDQFVVAIRQNGLSLSCSLELGVRPQGTVGAGCFASRDRVGVTTEFEGARAATLA